MNKLLANITTVLNKNQLLVGNVVGTILLKGLGLVLSLFSMPLYMDYFNDNIILGLWFTLLSMLNWIISFDLGLGNGVRNNLTIALADGDNIRSKRIISSGYFIIGIITVVFVGIVVILSFVADWNSFFNVSSLDISPKVLSKVVLITLSGLFLSFFLRLITSINAAIQIPIVNNVSTFVTSALLVLYLFVKHSNDPISNLENISWAYCIIVNLPLILVTLITFRNPKLSGCIPTFSYVDRKMSLQLLSIGLIFFILQLLFMIISVTNEWFISKFFSPEMNVDYQIYYRLFMVLTNLFMLILVPIIAAITKAFAEGRYSWIFKLKKTLYSITYVSSIIQILLVLFFQPIVDFWLKDKSIQIDYKVATIFAFTSIVSIWASVQSAIAIGLNKLNLQLVCYLFAVAFKIVFIVVISKISDDWSIVVLATGLCLLPYILIQPYELRKYLAKVSKQNNNNA